MVKTDKINKGKHRRMTVIVFDTEDNVIRSFHFSGNYTIKDVIEVLGEEFEDKPIRYQCFLDSASSKAKLLKYSTRSVNSMKNSILAHLGFEKERQK